MGSGFRASSGAARKCRRQAQVGYLNLLPHDALLSLAGGDTWAGAL